MKIVVPALILIAIGAGGGFLAFTVLSSRPWTSSAHGEGLEKSLRSAHLHVTQATFRMLQDFRTRRARWAAVGGGIGFGVGLPASILLSARTGGDATTLGLGGMYVGTQIGGAITARSRLGLDPERKRISSLQPHGLTDYLPRREIGAEAVVAFCGLVAGIVSLALIVRRGNPDRHEALLVLAATMFCGAVSLVVLVLQHRLVARPLGAEGSDEVVANDVILAMILRDLVFAVVVAVLFSCTGVLTWLQEPLWVTLAAIPLIMLVISRILNPSLRPNLIPVATALAGSGPVSSPGAR